MPRREVYREAGVHHGGSVRPRRSWRTGRARRLPVRVRRHRAERPEGKLEWMYAATPEQATRRSTPARASWAACAARTLVDGDPSSPTAWQTTTGRPDVTIAVLDSGIKWNDRGAMTDLRSKIRLNRGELPQPRHDRAAALEPGVDCAPTPPAYDANGDGVFNVARLRVRHARRARPRARRRTGVGPAGPARPAGRADRVHRRHGRRRQRLRRRHRRLGLPRRRQRPVRRRPVRPRHRRGARLDAPRRTTAASSAPARTASSIPLRVGDSFVADVNDFAQATIYAVDNDVLRRPGGARHAQQLERSRAQAVEYAYRHGVAVIASAADEAAQHHNWPSNDAAHDRRQLGHEVRRDAHAAAALLPPVQRLHELLVEDHRRDPERELLLGRHRARRGHGRPDLQRRADAREAGELARTRPAARERRPLRDQRQRGPPAHGIGRSTAAGRPTT